jgi:hypothetical protein
MVNECPTMLMVRHSVGQLVRNARAAVSIYSDQMCGACACTSNTSNQVIGTRHKNGPNKKYSTMTIQWMVHDDNMQMQRTRPGDSLNGEHRWTCNKCKVLKDVRCLASALYRISGRIFRPIFGSFFRPTNKIPRKSRIYIIIIM